MSGQIDFDADYVHVTPFIGLELPRRWQQWEFDPHLLIAVPLPRRGVTGHITVPDLICAATPSRPATVPTSAIRR